ELRRGQRERAATAEPLRPDRVGIDRNARVDLVRIDRHVRLKAAALERILQPGHPEAVEGPGNPAAETSSDRKGSGLVVEAEIAAMGAEVELAVLVDAPAPGDIEQRARIDEDAAGEIARGRRRGSRRHRDDVGNPRRGVERDRAAVEPGAAFEAAAG